MPTATESKNPNFITDHGSTRATVSRTRREPVTAVVACIERACMGDDPAVAA